MQQSPYDQPQVQVIAKEKTPRIAELKLPITAPQVTEIETPTFEISRKHNIEEAIELNGAQSTSFLIKLTEEESMIQHTITTSISDVSTNSLYTIIVTFNGTEIYNAQHTGAVTLETTNCSVNHDIKIYLINSTSKPFNANLTITNYGQEKEIN